MRQCPFTDCTVNLPSDKFACGRHWYRIPYNLQREVFRIYHAYLADEIGLEELARRQAAIVAEVEVPH